MNKENFNEQNSILIRQHRNGDRKAYEKLIENNLNLVRSIAYRFNDRGQETEDLIEVGKIGLLKAIEGFDDSLGYSFSTYAFPLISGEIKRFLRDDGIIKVSRSIKKNAADILRAKQEYTKEHGKTPKISELCEMCSLSFEQVLEALDAANPVISLQDKVNSEQNDTTVADFIPDEDKISSFTEILALRETVKSLSEFDRKLIELRYFKDFTQVRTAKILGVSQVTVSRSEKRILQKLRDEII